MHTYAIFLPYERKINATVCYSLSLRTENSIRLHPRYFPSVAPSHAYRIMAFAIHQAATVIGRQSTVIIMQAHITHTWQLPWPTYTARVYATLCRPYSYYVRRIAVD